MSPLAAGVRLARPSAGEIAACLATEAAFSYPEVGATREHEAGSLEVAARYDVDRHEFPIGYGRACFVRARESLARWRHFEVPWLELHGAGTPASEGQVVATLVWLAGLWFLNPCRVVYTEPGEESGDSAGFAYGTLAGHAVRGEERFRVWRDPSSDLVRYEILAFSRPASLLVRLGHPFARRVQRRFARASAAALARACA